MIWETLGAKHQRTSSSFFPMNAPRKMNQLGSHACQWVGGWGCLGSFSASPFHLPPNMKGEEGNRCHTSRYGTKPPDCILDSDTLRFFFFFPPYSKSKCSCTAWLTHCLIGLSPLIFLNLSFSSVPLLHNLSPLFIPNAKRLYWNWWF